MHQLQPKIIHLRKSKEKETITQQFTLFNGSDNKYKNILPFKFVKILFVDNWGSTDDGYPKFFHEGYIRLKGLVEK